MSARWIRKGNRLTRKVSSSKTARDERSIFRWRSQLLHGLNGRLGKRTGTRSHDTGITVGCLDDDSERVVDSVSAAK